LPCAVTEAGQTGAGHQYGDGLARHDHAVAEDEFAIWRYVFATETDIKKSKSWEELLVHTTPER